MPHGGNLAEGVLYEIKKHFSSESIEARKKEQREWRLQKEEAKKSLKEFERNNPQYLLK